MYDREFETFLLKEVLRGNKVFRGIMIAYGCCSIACAIMAVAAVIIYGRESLTIMLKLLSLMLAFAVACYGARSVARSDMVAVEEMAAALEKPECNVPDDYSDMAKRARDKALRNLRSIKGLIISYGIIAFMLWAATLLFVFLAGIGTNSVDSMMLTLALITFAMALPLTILSVAYIRDLPNYRKYRRRIEEIAPRE